MLRHLALPALLLAASPALANDSTAELGTGGLVLSRTDAIEMQKEDLSISPEKVSVDYVFHNVSDSDVDTIVAFPMPDIEGNPYELPSIPNDPNDNFLNFQVSVDGVPVKPELQQKAYAASVDVTADLQAQNVPLYPNGDAVLAALAKVPDAVAQDWVNRGIIIIDEYDDGSGDKKVRSPFWQLRSTYWWKAKFPAGKDVKVSHTYQPSVGGSAGLNFFSDGKIGGDGYADYKARYCMDSAFENAVMDAAKKGQDGYPQLYESRIAYILTTGGNWATGSIGDFTLTVDKGDPKALVSFCGTDVKKIGPTTFQMKAKDFYPDHDLDILILNSWDDNGDGAQPGEAPATAPDANPAPQPVVPNPAPQPAAPTSNG